MLTTALRALELGKPVLKLDSLKRSILLELDQLKFELSR